MKTEHVAENSKRIECIAQHKDIGELGAIEQDLMVIRRNDPEAKPNLDEVAKAINTVVYDTINKIK